MHELVSLWHRNTTGVAKQLRQLFTLWKHQAFQACTLYSSLLLAAKLWAGSSTEQATVQRQSPVALALPARALLGQGQYG